MDVGILSIYFNIVFCLSFTLLSVFGIYEPILSTCETAMALTLENSGSWLLGTHPYIPALAGGNTARALLLLLASSVREGKLLSLCMTYA